MEAVRTLFVDTDTTGLVRRELPVGAVDQPRIVQVGMSLHFRTNGDGAVPFVSNAGADPSEWPEDLRVQEFPR